MKQYDFSINRSKREKIGLLNFKKIFIAPFYGWGSTVSWLQSHYEETVYFLPLKKNIKVIKLINFHSL